MQTCITTGRFGIPGKLKFHAAKKSLVKVKKKDFRFGGMGGSIHYLQLVLVIYAQLVTIDKKSFLAPLTLLLKTSLKFKVLNTHNFIPLPSPLGTCLNIALTTSKDLYNIH